MSEPAATRGLTGAVADALRDHAFDLDDCPHGDDPCDCPTPWVSGTTGDVVAWIEGDPDGIARIAVKAFEQWQRDQLRAVDRPATGPEPPGAGLLDGLASAQRRPRAALAVLDTVPRPGKGALHSDTCHRHRADCLAAVVRKALEGDDGEV